MQTYTCTCIKYRIKVSRILSGFVSGMEINKLERPQSVYVGSHFISLMSPPPRSTQQLIGGVYELSLLYRKEVIIK